MKSNLLVLIVSKGDFFHGIGADYVHKQRHTNVDKNKIQTHTKRTQTETNKTYTTAYNNYYTHMDKKKHTKKYETNKQTDKSTILSYISKNIAFLIQESLVRMR